MIFQQHWPRDEKYTCVDFVRDGSCGNGAARCGDSRWSRITEVRAGAKSVFHFDVPGSVAKSTHAGIPSLRFLRMRVGDRVHFWLFDGWKVLAGKSAVVKVYPAVWPHLPARWPRFPPARCLCRCGMLRRSDLDGSLEPRLEKPRGADSILNPSRYRSPAFSGY